jgi:hypothetical protein
MRPLLILAGALLLLPVAAHAYTCGDFVAARNIDAQGPPFSRPMGDAIRFIATVHPSVAADNGKLSAVGYLTGVYCAEPGHYYVPLHVAIDEMIESLGDDE